MTTGDWKQVVIVVKSKDGQHLMAETNDNNLINHIAESCVFDRLKSVIVEHCTLKEIMEN